MDFLVKSRFKIGDIIFGIEECYKHPKCKTCNGTGKLELLIGGEVNCVNCHGTKEDESFNLTYWKPTKSIKIKGLVFYIEENKEVYVTYYGLDDETGYDICIEENLAFKTLEEAKIECEKRGIIEEID